MYHLHVIVSFLAVPITLWLAAYIYNLRVRARRRKYRNLQQTFRRMTQLNTYLIDMGYYPRGRCQCKGKPFRWTSRDGYEVRLYADETWQLRHSDQTLRYGHIETAIDEINDYYQKLMGQD